MYTNVEQVTSRRNVIVAAFRAVAAGQVAAHDRVLLDGRHLVEEAIRAGLSITVLAMTASRLADDPAAAALASSLADADTRVLSVTDRVMEAMSPVTSPSGFVALAERPTVTLDEVMARRPQLVLGLVDIQNPGNLGAIIRTAHAGDATGVVTTGECTDPYGWKALRGAMGGTFRIPVVRRTAPMSLVAHARSCGLEVVAIVARGGTQLYDVDLTRPTLAMVGGEGTGLPQDLVSAADGALSIPMLGAAESLNAATAAGLVIYEAFRQRHIASAHPPATEDDNR